MLVPVILGGVAALSVLCAQWLPVLVPSLVPTANPIVPALASGASVASISAVFVLLALRPIRRILSAAPPVLPVPPPAKRAMGEFDRLGVVAEQMVGALGKLDARALFPDMVGESQVMRGVFAQILKVAATDVTVLLLGESGSGKELVARGVHEKSPRLHGPFVAVNCAAIPSGLLESELFGHEKGAFTGASARRYGKFEQARGGTLFLDEIGDMPLEIQAKILRVLESRHVEPLGAGRPVPVDARIIAATHRDLPAMIREGTFREDLFHRLNVFPLRLPPLRERREDIPVMAGRFLEELTPGATISMEALQRLLAYDWPGNVRELKNVIARAAVLCSEATVSSKHLPGLAMYGFESFPAESRADIGLDGLLATYERSLIEAALSQTAGVQVRAAQLLRIKERSLWHRVKKLGIHPTNFKDSSSKESIFQK